MDIRAGRASLVENLQPVLQSGLTTAFGYDTFYNKEVDKSFGTFLDQMFVQAPLPTGVKRVLKSDEQRAEDNKSRINPRSKTNEIVRVFGGSPTPQPYNPVVGKRAVALDNGDAGEAYVLDITRKAEEAGVPSPPQEILEEAKWRGMLDRAVDRKSGRSRAEAALKVFIERYPERSDLMNLLSDEMTDQQVDAILSNARKYLYPSLNAYERALDATLESR
jgi:hypothetical protein